MQNALELHLLNYNLGQEDPSQSLALASIWILLLALGTIILLLPALYTINITSWGAFRSSLLLENVNSPLQSSTLNSCLSVGPSFLIGLPISSASG